MTTFELISIIATSGGFIVSTISLIRSVRADRRSKALLHEVDVIRAESIQLQETVAKLLKAGRGGSGGAGGRGGNVVLDGGSVVHGEIRNHGGAGGVGGRGGGIERKQ